MGRRIGVIRPGVLSRARHYWFFGFRLTWTMTFVSHRPCEGGSETKFLTGLLGGDVGGFDLRAQVGPGIARMGHNRRLA